MDPAPWHLFSLRTQIDLRLMQLGTDESRRRKIRRAISEVTDIPRLHAFARRLDSRYGAQTQTKH